MKDAAAVAEQVYEGEPVALEPVRNSQIAPSQSPAMMSPDTLRAEIARQREMRDIMTEYVKSQMVEGHHYYYFNKLGKQGQAEVGGPRDDKPALSQDGAYLIMGLFKCTPGRVETQIIRHEDEHFTVVAEAPIFNAEGALISTGNGSCSTRESKYAYRKGERVCPECGAAAIIKGKDFSGKGGPTDWICFAKKGGCGAKFADDDNAITGQQIGRVDNPDLADLENTVLKMAVKRATVAAVRKLPLVSELFSTDPQDGAGGGGREQAKPQSRNASPRSSQQPAAPSDAHGRASIQTSAVQTAVDLSKKLQKEYGVSSDELAAQFLPEGVSMFSNLTEEQAADINPGLSALINAKIAEAKEPRRG